MPAPCSFRQVEEKHATEARLMIWSPQMDLLALANVQGEVKIFSDYYRPPTKLQEGNVVTGMCVCRQGAPMWLLPMMHWVSLYRLPGPVPQTSDMGPPWSQPHQPPPQHQSWDPQPHPSVSGIWWPSLETCSNLFT